MLRPVDDVLRPWTRDEARQQEIVELFDDAQHEHMIREVAWVLKWWWNKERAKTVGRGDVGHEHVLARARRRAAERRADPVLYAEHRAKCLGAADERRAKKAMGAMCKECGERVAPTKRMGRVPTMHPVCNRRRASRAWWRRKKEREAVGSSRPTHCSDGASTSTVVRRRSPRSTT